MLSHLPLIVTLAFATTPHAWATAAVEPGTGKSTQARTLVKAPSSAASAPASKTLVKKLVPQRSVPAASSDAALVPGKAPALGLCDGS